MSTFYGTFAKHVDLTIVKHISHAQSLSTRIFWLICLVAVSGITVYQVSGLIEQLNSNSVLTSIKMKTSPTKPFPAVTFCNMNPYKKSALLNLPQFQTLLDAFNYANTQSRIKRNSVLGSVSFLQRQKRKGTLSNPFLYPCTTNNDCENPHVCLPGDGNSSYSFCNCFCGNNSCSQDLDCCTNDCNNNVCTTVSLTHGTICQSGCECGIGFVCQPWGPYAYCNYDISTSSAVTTKDMTTTSNSTSMKNFELTTIQTNILRNPFLYPCTTNNDCKNSAAFCYNALPGGENSSYWFCGCNCGAMNCTQDWDCCTNHCSNGVCTAISLTQGTWCKSGCDCGIGFVCQPWGSYAYCNYNISTSSAVTTRDTTTTQTLLPVAANTSKSPIVSTLPTNEADSTILTMNEIMNILDLYNNTNAPSEDSEINITSSAVTAKGMTTTQTLLPVVTSASKNPIVSTLPINETDSIILTMNEIMDILNLYNNTDALSQGTEINAAFPYLISTLSAFQRMQLGYNIEDLMLHCKFDGKTCDKTDFVEWNDASIGNCFTFNHIQGIHHSTQYAGSEHGLNLLFNASQNDYLPTTDTAGLIIFITYNNATIFTDQTSFSLPPGYIMDISVAYEYLSRLQLCIGEKSAENYFYNEEYSVQGCLKTCYQKQVLAECGCGDPSYPLPPVLPQMSEKCSLIKKPCVDSIANSIDMNSQNCTCPQQCLENVFSPTPTLTKVRNDLDADLASINVYHDTMLYFYLQEIPAYSLADFYNDFCNILGNNLEIGFHPVIEILGLIFLFLGSFFM